MRRLGVELRALEGHHAVVQREVGRAGNRNRVARIEYDAVFLASFALPSPHTFEDFVFVPAIRETAGGRRANAAVLDRPVVEELLDRDAVVAELDVHRIRLGVLRQRNARRSFRRHSSPRSTSIARFSPLTSSFPFAFASSYASAAM